MRFCEELTVRSPGTLAPTVLGCLAIRATETSTRENAQVAEDIRAQVSGAGAATQTANRSVGGPHRAEHQRARSTRTQHSGRPLGVRRLHRENPSKLKLNSRSSWKSPTGSNRPTSQAGDHRRCVARSERKPTIPTRSWLWISPESSYLFCIIVRPAENRLRRLNNESVFLRPRRVFMCLIIWCTPESSSISARVESSSTQ